MSTNSERDAYQPDAPDFRQFEAIVRRDELNPYPSFEETLDAAADAMASLRQQRDHWRAVWDFVLRRLLEEAQKPEYAGDDLDSIIAEFQARANSDITP